MPVGREAGYGHLRPPCLPRVTGCSRVLPIASRVARLPRRSFARRRSYSRRQRSATRSRDSRVSSVGERRSIPRTWFRGSSGGCDSPDCVIPLCRTHHRLYDDGQLRLDVHVGRGCRRERAHALTHVSAARSRRAMRGLGWERGARVRIGDLFYSDHGDARLRRGARTPSGSARRGRPGVDRRERRGVAAVRGGARREPAGSRGAAARGAP